ncbi:MAG: FecR domain-containing protein [Phenylobacterium sp.]|uniref:FecR family protein n=1 Tax=Phenylobacterium sp. TaxID=1871053 RepID=UPI001A57F4C1|nr:FecR domain-containing protein [Phenylobacterium sp.]MBL8772689.1 FecR domain-containing protein [Phenylobacterium sp.]
MNLGWRYGDETRREDAAVWVVRLEAGDLREAEAVAFDAWLSASPQNAAAFDAALAVSQGYGAQGHAVARALAERRATPAPVGVGRRAALGLGAAAAAAAVAVVLAPELAGPETQTFVTAKGERRTIALPDGSTLDLNGGTRLTVSFSRGARRVTLEEGQAVFDVAHAARRPFVVAAGDRLVRVVGTQFDVRRLGGQVSVTVARGSVEVRPGDGAAGEAYRLRPGQRFEHEEGAAEARVAAAEPRDVLAWRTGRLIYREQPLREVVDDLNQKFQTPIRIEDPALGAMPISGVLVLDDQAAVIRRLALLVPISAVRSGSAVVLKRDPASDR